MHSPLSPPRPLDSPGVDRALSCRCVLWTRPEPGAGPEARLEELDVRRCPVGPILAVDCPEWAGVPCRMWSARGAEPPTVLARDEASAMLAALAAEGTLSERYRRRLRPLTAELPAGASSAGDGMPVRGVAAPVGVTARGARLPPPLRPPVGVPADRERRRAPAVGTGPEAGPGPGRSDGSREGAP